MNNPGKNYEKIEHRTGSGAMFFGTAWAIGNTLIAGVNKLTELTIDDAERKAMLARDIQGSLEGTELGLRVAALGACFITISLMREQMFPTTNEFGIPNGITNWYEP